MPIEFSLEALKDLENRRTQIIDAAAVEAISKIDALIRDLHALGIEYELVKVGDRHKSSAIASAREIKQCKYCNFDTIPQHDARWHKTQKPRRQAFTDEELTSHGMKRV